MYKIIEYDESYNKKVKNFIIEVFVEEFEIERAREHIEKENIIEEYILKGGNFWVAIDDNQNVISTIGAKPLDENVLEVKRLYLKKEYRGKGLAQEMYNILENFAIKKGFKKLFLGTYDKLERAVSFYYKNNFKEDESKEKRIGTKYMYKSLENIAIKL